MRIEKGHGHIFHLTLSGYEMASLISSARWVADGAKGELTDEAIGYLKQVVANYDKASGKFRGKLTSEDKVLSTKEK